MKTRNVIVGGILAGLAALLFISAIPNFRSGAERKRTVAALKQLRPDAVLLAARTFAKDKKFAGDAVPLREILSAGYLRAEDVRGLEDQDVTVSVIVNETDPNVILIRVRSEAGPDNVLLLDGSVQQVPKL